MGNVSMKRVCADAIANYLSANISGLAGKVSAVAAGPETFAECLALKVLPERFVFEPAQQDEVYEADPDDGKIVLDVGSYTGLFTLQLFTVNPAERELYEQKILDLFQATEWASGTLFITTPNLLINGYASLYQAEIKVRLDSEEWNDELAFEAKRYSFLEIDIDFPALTTRDISNLTSLQIVLAGVDDDIVSIDDTDLDYRVEVQEDGSTIKGTA